MIISQENTDIKALSSHAKYPGLFIQYFGRAPNIDDWEMVVTSPELP